MRLTGNKLHAYEQTLRIPMYVRGPLIKPGTVLTIPGSNADFAPTWLALAGISNSHMDGSSFVAHLLSQPTNDGVEEDEIKAQAQNISGNSKPWRDFHYSEYNSLGNLWRGGGDIMKGDHLIDDPISHTYR